MQMIHCILIILQVLTYARQSRERSNYEQAALNERMQEYNKQLIDRESRSLAANILIRGIVRSLVLDFSVDKKLHFAAVCGGFKHIVLLSKPSSIHEHQEDGKEYLGDQHDAKVVEDESLIEFCTMEVALEAIYSCMHN
ncbi:hypothetical protein TSUD_410630 [Trifolium subterraneum]|uniref:Uncharacterized protein n=1 Tax=Trifolium subterraneum TaxID=3900 RepID=A0A2Z6P4Y0_TRISU|nr:hypothetical protein TSUD_410630 [Trifolium subterraneum]